MLNTELGPKVQLCKMVLVLVSQPAALPLGQSSQVEVLHLAIVFLPSVALPSQPVRVSLPALAQLEDLTILAPSSCVGDFDLPVVPQEGILADTDQLP